MPYPHGSASWPGMDRIVRMSYTASHGITPGIAQVSYAPQAQLPDQYGVLSFTDTVKTRSLKGCRINTIRETRASGRVIELTAEIVDRRWQWKNFGTIDGWYNQLDPHGKLIPRYIRSPYELAVLCLQAQGETNYVIDLPPALSAKDGQNFDNFLAVGQQFPQTSTNPPVNWKSDPPMVVLSRLCDMFGRRVVFDPFLDLIRIDRIGIGGSLPDGHISLEGPSLRSPEIPDMLIVDGDPTRFQPRLPVEPVGLEWNGEYRPIDELSYTPTYQGAKQISTVTITLPPDGQRTGLKYRMRLQYFDKNDLPHDVTGTDDAVIDGVTAAAVLATVKSYLLLDDATLADYVDISVSSGVMTLTGKRAGESFSVIYHAFFNDADDPIPLTATSIYAVTQVARPAGKTWRYTDPQFFAQVTATDRLSTEQARALAQQSVWKCYRVTGEDAQRDGSPANIPGFGRIKFLQQIVLTNSKVDQITPTLGDQNILVRQFREPFIKVLYDGYSKDMPPTAYGSVYRHGVLAKFDFVGEASPNTPEGTEILIPYSVNAPFHVITFSAPVFKFIGGRYEKPNIDIEIGVMIRDPNTYQLVSYKAARTLVSGKPTGTRPRVYRHADVQLNVTATYRSDGSFTAKPLEDDPFARANYYLDAHSLEYFTAAGLTRSYNGIEIVNLDGAVCQVTYEVTERGTFTKASRNTEHMVWTPAYPVRRRAENLDAAQRKTGIRDRTRLKFIGELDFDLDDANG